MPNTARGGGISRKITNAVDRKKLKEIAGEIEVPQGAGLIVRTAGAKRTKTEIKRDYEYLQRLWEQIRELTLKSIAPSKIYEEGDLIKRSIRDLYNRDIDEVQVEGERGYRIAKDFMKMIMPSHAKNVRHYQDSLPLFARFQVESYLNSMFNPVVQLKSGGYIVIDVTEALVAVDVNSGRATKEGSIEDTALKTNLEAAEEVSRQLRLRDLAGLIVIDFIDMDERKNNLSVEKRIKDKLKTDRARIQIGRISGFGLMEMSRQRLRPGMIEATTQACPHCHGTGLIRSDDNLALSILRQIEEEGVRRRSREVVVTCPVGIANFLMNQKREHIAQIEARYGMSVRIEGDPSLVSPDFNIEKLKTATRVLPEPDQNVVSVDSNILDQIDAEAEAEAEAEAQSPDEDEADVAATEAGSDEEQKPKKRRRRRRRRKSGGPEGEDAGISVEADANAATDENAAEQPAGDPSQTDTAPQDAGSVTALTQTEDPLAGSSDAVPVEVNAGSTDSAEAVDTGEAATEEAPKKPARKRSTTTRKRAKKLVVDEATTTDVAPEPATEPVVEGAAETAAEEEPVKKPRRLPKKVDPVKDAAEDTAQPETEQAAPVVESAPVPEAAVSPVVETAAEPQDVVPTSAAAPVLEFVKEVPAPEPVIEQVPTEPEAPAKPKRRGWWSLEK
jgi:ribonuclease E